jgi:cytochrome c peroxidase
MPRPTRTLFLISVFVSLILERAAAWPHVDSDVTADAVQNVLQPDFTPPAPGTYTLPPIATVHDHRVIDTSGKPVSLFDLTKDKIAVLSFMYTSCSDVGGCPLAATVLQQIDQMVATRPELASQIALFSVSFDVERDTPARLAEIRQALAPHTTWHFLTTASQEDLQALLTDFHQPVAKLWNADGSWSGLFRHVLKVYLIDSRHRVRNIYSTGLFSAQLVINDIETVLLDTAPDVAEPKEP